MTEIYTTKFWNDTHPAIPYLKVIADRYFPSGTSKLYLAKTKAANPKIKRLRELIHKHYRFYNDGDSFTIGEYKAIYSKWKHYASGKSTNTPLSYYEIERTNIALHKLEKEISDLTYKIYSLTKEERARPVDQYGRIHRSLPENFTG